MTSVLIIDDDVGLSRTLVISLRARGYEVYAAGTGRSGLQAACSCGPDVVVLDLGLPDMDGLDVLRALRERGAIPVLILTARRGGEDRAAAFDAGADDVVIKPVAFNTLLDHLRRLW